MHRSAGAASRRWWDATRRAEARATASSADIVGPRRARDPTVGEEEPSETFRLFVGYFGWRSARRNSARVGASVTSRRGATIGGTPIGDHAALAHSPPSEPPALRVRAPRSPA